MFFAVWRTNRQRLVRKNGQHWNGWGMRDKPRAVTWHGPSMLLIKSYFLFHLLSSSLKGDFSIALHRTVITRGNLSSSQMILSKHFITLFILVPPLLYILLQQIALNIAVLSSPVVVSSFPTLTPVLIAYGLNYFWMTTAIPFTVLLRWTRAIFFFFHLPSSRMFKSYKVLRQNCWGLKWPFLFIFCSIKLRFHASKLTSNRGRENKKQGATMRKGRGMRCRTVIRLWRKPARCPAEQFWSAHFN